MKKIESVQALRGIAVLLVVLFHLIPIEKKYGGSETILPSIFNVGMIGVDIFFVISGFIMISITREKFHDRKNALEFIYHRISRIYPTYWVYSFVVLGIFLLKPTLVNSSQGNEANILASFLLLPSEKLPLLMVGWTLIHEMYFYIVFFIFMIVLPEKKIIHALLSWGLSIVCINVFLRPDSPFVNLISHPLTVEFILGCLIAIFYHRNKTESSKTTALALLLAAIVAFIISIFGVLIYSQQNSFTAPQGWWRILILGIPALIMVFCLINAEKSGILINSLLIKIGDASYSIYLSHILTLSAAGKIWINFSSNLTWDNYIMIPSLFILTIVVGFISYNYIEKPLLIYSRKLYPPKNT